MELFFIIIMTIVIISNLINFFSKIGQRIDNFEKEKKKIVDEINENTRKQEFNEKVPGMKKKGDEILNRFSLESGRLKNVNGFLPPQKSNAKKDTNQDNYERLKKQIRDLDDEITKRHTQLKAFEKEILERKLNIKLTENSTYLKIQNAIEIARNAQQKYKNELFKMG